MEDSQEARTWWKQWIWVEKLIFPVSVTQKEQLSGVFISDFEKSAFMRHPNLKRPWIFINLKFKNTKMKIDLKFNKNTKKKMKCGLEKVSYWLELDWNKINP